MLTKFVVLLLFVLVYTMPVYAQQESRARIEETSDLQTNPILATPLPENIHRKEESKPIQVFKEVRSSSMFYTLPPTAKPTARSLTRFKKYLKPARISADTVKANPLRRLGCFLREPLKLIDLALDYLEYTKPPQTPFLIVLYVLYIIPLFAIITIFIMVGVVGLAGYIALCGLTLFLMYWGILALLGIALVGSFLLWGIIGAFLIGLGLYVILVSLC